MPNYLRCDYISLYYLGRTISMIILCSKFLFVTVKEKFPKSREKVFFNTCIQSVGNLLMQDSHISPVHLKIKSQNETQQAFIWSQRITIL